MRRVGSFVVLVMLFLCPVLHAVEPVIVKIGSLKAAAPETWKSVKPANRLRSFQFQIPSPESNLPAAELVVMPESERSAEKAFPRWRAMFVPPEGQSAENLGSVRKLEIPGASITLLDITGTWRYREFPMAKKEEIRPDYRVVWAIVVTKDEATHLRLSGPAGAMEKRVPEFETWLKSLK